MRDWGNWVSHNSCLFTGEERIVLSPVNEARAWEAHYDAITPQPAVLTNTVGTAATFTAAAQGDISCTTASRINNMKH